MISSFDLRIEVEALQELDSYDIPHDYDLTTEDPGRLLEGDYLIFNPTQNLTIW
jgi:condensin complex subunit 1